MQKIFILRWGHRARDFRVTTHVALTARAFGADGLYLSDVIDDEVKKTIMDVVRRWGGSFVFEMGLPWREIVKHWRRRGGLVIHLTMYGDALTHALINELKDCGKDLLLLVGSRKVPGAFYSPSVSDYNISIGNQPHSEVSAIAVFLDRFFQGKKLYESFESRKPWGRKSRSKDF